MKATASTGRRMHAWLFASSGAFLLLAGLAAPMPEHPGEGTAPACARLRKAALSVIEALSPAQKEKSLFPFASEERHNWHFIPRPRKGLPLKEMDDTQKAKVLDLLRAGLSADGAKKAEGVMALEEVLRVEEAPANPAPGAAPKAPRIVRDPLLYYIAFFGTPQDGGRWGFRIEGHHLSLNWTIDKDEVSASTPQFYGANPALVRRGPKQGQRLLAGIEDTARELALSLDPPQLKACQGEKGGAVPEEVPGTEAPRYTGPYPEGIASGELRKEQKEILRKLLGEYTRNFADEVRDAIRKKIGDEDLKEIHFAWRGSLKAFEPHSYLVHGPTFVINYTNMQNSGAHVHSAFRDLAGEGGL